MPRRGWQTYEMFWHVRCPAIRKTEDVYDAMWQTDVCPSGALNGGDWPLPSHRSQRPTSHASHFSGLHGLEKLIYYQSHFNADGPNHPNTMELLGLLGDDDLPLAVEVRNFQRTARNVPRKFHEVPMVSKHDDRRFLSQFTEHFEHGRFSFVIERNQHVVHDERPGFALRSELFDGSQLQGQEKLVTRAVAEPFHPYALSRGTLPQQFDAALDKADGFFGACRLMAAVTFADSAALATAASSPARHRKTGKIGKIS